MNEDCLKIQERYWEYRSNQLDSRQKGELLAHLESCKNCQTQFEAFQAVETELDLLETVEPSSWFDQKLHARLNELGSLRKSVSWWQILVQPRWVMAYSTLLVCALGGWFALRPSMKPPSDSPSLVRGVATPPSDQTTPVPQVASIETGKPDLRVAPLPESGGEISPEDLAILENMDLLENYDLLQNLDFKKQN